MIGVVDDPLTPFSIAAADVLKPLSLSPAVAAAVAASAVTSAMPATIRPLMTLSLRKLALPAGIVNLFRRRSNLELADHQFEEERRIAFGGRSPLDALLEDELVGRVERP